MEDGVEDGAGGLELVVTEGTANNKAGKADDVGQPGADGGGVTVGDRGGW